jgi:hypothetical protein
MFRMISNHYLLLGAMVGRVNIHFKLPGIFHNAKWIAALHVVLLGFSECLVNTEHPEYLNVTR